MMRTRGWYSDGYRHSLAAKGIRTSLSAKELEVLPLKNLKLYAYDENKDVAKAARIEIKRREKQ